MRRMPGYSTVLIPPRTSSEDSETGYTAEKFISQRGQLEEIGEAAKEHLPQCKGQA